MVVDGSSDGGWVVVVESRGAVSDVVVVDSVGADVVVVSSELEVVSAGADVSVELVGSAITVVSVADWRSSAEAAGAAWM